MAVTGLDDRGLRRALRIKGRPYTLAIDADGFKLTEKGRRLGLEIRWEDLVSGEAALVTALNASLTAPVGRPAPRHAGAATPGRRRSTT